MKAIVYRRFGQPDVLEIEEIDKPAVPDDGVLVRVQVVSVNPVDWYPMTGTPYVARIEFGLLKPKDGRPGVDFAGTVESVGKDVTRFKPGDEVFGGKSGALAEYVCVAEGRAIATKPSNLTFEEAASLPVAGVTALQGLRDKGRIRAGQKVLINGASGGVGTFAVQIAKAFGAEVTGVCSPRNVDLVRSIGADYVIDYTKEDFTRGATRYDLMLDIAGSKSWSECKRVLAPDASFVVVGGAKKGALLGPLSHALRVRLSARGTTQNVVWFFLANLTQQDLLVLKEMAEQGKLKPVIDRRFAFSETREALRYLGTGHARGKVVVDLEARQLHASQTIAAVAPTSKALKKT